MDSRKLRHVKSAPKRWSRACLVVVSAVTLIFVLGGCGGDEASVDKSAESLNYSRASAVDAGLYGADEFTTPSETTSTDTTSTDTTSTDTTPTEPTPSEGYGEYVAIQDATGSISFEAPAEWADTVTEAAATSPFQAAAAATPDLEKFTTTWEMPGVFIGLSKSLGRYVADSETPALSLPKVFGAVSPREDLHRDCEGPNTFFVGITSDNVFEETLGDLVDLGIADSYSNCGGNGTQFIDFAGYSEANTMFVYFQLQILTEADFEAAARFLVTLQLDNARVPEPSSEQTTPELLLP